MTVTCVDAVFPWDVSQSAVTLGLSYIGLLDELAIFNRPLTDAEVKAIYQAPQGLAPRPGVVCPSEVPPINPCVTIMLFFKISGRSRWISFSV